MYMAVHKKVFKCCISPSSILEGSLNDPSCTHNSSQSFAMGLTHNGATISHDAMCTNVNGR